MCNRQKLNENQMCNKLNVCGIAHLYHIVQFTCILGSEPTTEHYPECLSSHLKNNYKLQCFYHSVKMFFTGTETEWLFVENNHH